MGIGPVPPNRLDNLMGGVVDSGVRKIADFLGVDPEDLGKLATKGARETAEDIVENPLDVYEALKKLWNPELVNNIAGGLADIMIDTWQDPQLQAIAINLGRAVSQPFIQVLEEYGDLEDYDAHDFASAFHGNTIMLMLPSMLLRAFRGSAIGAAIGPVGEAIEQMYFVLGLGFMGWQTISPLIEAGMTNKLTRYYNAKFTPSRASLTTYARAYYKGELPLTKFIKEILAAGYSYDEGTLAIEDTFRALSKSEIKDMLDTGRISREGAAHELIHGGYNPKYVNGILDALVDESTDKDKGPSISSARNAFESGLRTEQEFRLILQALNYSDEAIKLEIELIRQKQNDEWRKLTLGQMRKAFIEDVISTQQIYQYLKGELYSDADINTLLKTWQAEKAPPVLDLTKSDITAAFREGVLGYTEAINRLVTIGYDHEEAKLLVDTVVQRLQRTAVQIPLNYVMAGLSKSILTNTEFSDLLSSLGYNQFAVDVLRNIALDNPFNDITQEDISRAFLYGAIPEITARNLMGELGVVDRAIDIRIETIKQQKQTARYKLSPGYIALFYKQGIIDQQEAFNRLVENGLDSSDARLVIQSTDTPIPRDVQENDIKEFYITGIIDAAKAGNLLIGLGYSLEESRLFIDSWNVLLGQSLKQPSVTQLLTGLQKGILTEEMFANKLNAIGYSDAAIDYYLSLKDEPVTQSTRELTKADILGLYEDNFLSYVDALDRLIRSGYDAADAELLLARRKQTIESTEYHALFMQGYLSAEQYIQILLGAGYTEQEIYAYLNRLGV